MNGIHKHKNKGRRPLINRDKKKAKWEGKNSLPNLFFMIYNIVSAIVSFQNRGVTKRRLLLRWLHPCSELTICLWYNTCQPFWLIYLHIIIGITVKLNSLATAFKLLSSGKILPQRPQFFSRETLENEIRKSMDE